MSSFVFRSFVFLAILFVSPIFVSNGFAAHGALPGHGLTSEQNRCFNPKSDEHLRIDIFFWCNKQSNPSRCHQISRDANHHYMGRCIAGLPIPPWSKIFGDARLEYLNKIPKRRTATSSAIDSSFATHCLRADRTNSFLVHR